MAIARLHGGPLDGQVIPVEGELTDRLILPYSETQVVYERAYTAYAKAQRHKGFQVIEARFEKDEDEPQGTTP